MKKNSPKCQVCFFQISPTTKITQLICCKKCKRTAHRFCYLPDCEDKFFQCDACANQYKKPECCICHNQGLVKRTEEGQYAHPVCLMFCQQSLVKKYKTLSFHLLRSKRKKKSFKCQICSKNSVCSDFIQCWQKQCSSKAHSYCILKQQWKDNEQTNRWVQNIKVFQKNSPFEGLQLFQSQIKKYIKRFSILSYRCIFDQNNNSENQVSHIAYCPKHYSNLVNCYCVAIEDNNTKQVDWIFCDSCSKWYHFQCQKIQEVSQAEEDLYTCRCCQSWHHKIESKQEPILQQYPKLHFYDFVYIQYYAQQKGYFKLSNSMLQLINKVPYLCSVDYFTQILKNKNVISRIIKSINFLPIKTLAANKQFKIKEQGKKNQKFDKSLIQCLWKIDLICALDPITALNKSKNESYKIEQILEILQKYNKKYSQGLNVLGPAIKELNKIKNKSKDQEQITSQSNESEDEDVEKASTILKNQINQIKNVHRNFSNGRKVFVRFYQKMNQIQVLKQFAKQYVDVKAKGYEILKPIFIYETQQQMFDHFRLNNAYTQLLSLFLHKKLCFKKQIDKLVIKIRHIFSQVTHKVKAQNSGIENQIFSLQISEQEPSGQYSNRQIMKSLTLPAKIENQVFQMMKLNYQNAIFSNIQLKSTSISKLSFELSHIRSASSYKKFMQFTKLYDTCRNFVQQLVEYSLSNQNLTKLDVDLLQIIKVTKIERQNVNKFCLFFTSVCPLSLQTMNKRFDFTISQLGNQFLNFMCSRPMVFQCQIQFKAACILMSKYKYQSQQTIQEIIKRNKQLEYMLKDLNFQCLQNMVFIQTYMKKLKEAKQFCQQNNLQFRISKIEYFMKLLQSKEEAFLYLPYSYVVKNKQNIPSKYLKIQQKKRIDLCLLKKILYKLKLLKFPQTDHLYTKVAQLYSQKIEYFNILSSVIAHYNSLLLNQQINVQFTKFKKDQILMLISSNSQQIVTCTPEEDQIIIICQLYDQVLVRMRNIVQSQVVDQEEILLVYKDFVKFPFMNDQNDIWRRFSKLLNSIKTNKTSIKLEANSCSLQNIQNPILFKKSQLDETSANKGEYSRKECKQVQQILAQIKSQPRVLTCQQIQKRMANLKSKITKDTNSAQLYELIKNANDLGLKYRKISDKLTKRQSLGQKDLEQAKNLRKQYERQPIKIDSIESIMRQMKEANKVPIKKNQPNIVRIAQQYSSISKQGKNQQSVSSSKSPRRPSHKQKKKKLFLHY